MTAPCDRPVRPPRATAPYDRPVRPPRQVLPHMEDAGWALLQPMRSLWEEGRECCDGPRLEDVAATVDANTAAVLRVVAARVASGECAGGDELEFALALVANPLAGEAGGGEGGRDSCKRRYASAEEFWGEAAAEGSGGDGWYGGSAAYWDDVAADVDGMLGGLGHLHAPDVQGSLAFIDELRRADGLPTGAALDCGAGIGRVSASVLLERFECAELLEPSRRFLQQARAALPAHRLRAAHEQPLQLFSPPAAAAYAVVWVQWVANYLTDEDLAAFLRRCASALAPGGAVVLKESVAREGTGFYVDRSDSSITRTDAQFRAVFAAAGLRLVREAETPELPREIFPVRMFALRPK